MNELECRYREWITLHPHVFLLFESFALEMRDRDAKFGIGMLAERVRWEVAASWLPSDGYKINNNYRAYLARDRIAKHPELARLMTTRKVRSEEQDATLIDGR